jgi:hypothetical protein
MGFAWCFIGDPATGIDWAIMVAAGGLAFSCLLFIWRAAGGLVLATTHLLDERQRSVRDRAFRIAYLILSLVFLAGTAFYSWRFVRPEQSHGTHFVLPVGIGVILLSLTLPLAVVAWTEPDPPEDSGTFTKTVP